jgi:hypothetical protein
MAEIINLRRARKAKGRRDNEATAASNRVDFGRPKLARKWSQKEARRLNRVLDQSKID